MFRSVLVIILVIAVLWIGRILLQRLKNPLNQNQKNTIREPISQDTVQCAYCKTYITPDQALINNQRTFCCQEHLNQWKP